MFRAGSTPRALRTVLALVTIGLLFMATPAAAQAPGGNQMCGDGTTFDVALPGRSLELADTAFFSYQVVSGHTAAPADAVTLPRGCSIYLLIVGDYGQNAAFDKIPFFKVAEHVAKRNGYLHVSWWNNFNKEYMGGPLHQTTTTISGPFGGNTATLSTNPGAYDAQTQIPGLGFAANFLDKPKAVPVEDRQFLQDARTVIAAIRQHSPGALVVVLGHGMGAAAAARLGAINTGETSIISEIDLLALIDPVGNRDKPRDPTAAAIAKIKIDGFPIGELLNLFVGDALNWSRWRAVHRFRGYRRWDCRRGLFNLCQRFFVGGKYKFLCEPTGSYLSTPPAVTTLAPLGCPLNFPYQDPGTRLKFSSNVKNLYHRWQTEFFAPVGYLWTQTYDSYLPRSSSIDGPNYQEVASTCRSGVDQHNVPCGPFDGHGELIGIRGGDAFGNGRTYPGLELANWPSDPAGRRQKLIELAAAGAAWNHRPSAPELCLVCDDIIAIVDRLLAAQPAPVDTVPPVTTAAALPGPGATGWNAEDVVIDLLALDGSGGSGVTQIEHSLSGAQAAAPTVTPGGSAQVTITEHGTTTLTFFARDAAGNVEAPGELVVKMDKMFPEIAAVPDQEPNAAGWNRTDVTLSFPASDEGSGLAASSPPVTIATEGAGQDVLGSATDHAGNISTATATLNIDKTGPSIAFAGRTPANTAGWNRTDVTLQWNCTDALSGPLEPLVTQGLTTQGAGQSATGTCTDLADNTADDTQGGINIDKTAPTITFAGRMPAANAAGWHRTDVTVQWTCADALSGPRVPAVTAGLTTEGAAQTVIGTCADLADNTAGDTQGGINIDKTAPAVAIAAPAHGSAYLLNQVLAADYGCSDSLSGVASCSGPVPVGGAADTSSPGGKQFTVTGTDAAGNAASATTAYSVHYAFSGFAQPIAALPGASIVKAGRTVPVKYSLQDAGGAFIGDVTTIVSLESAPTSCDAGAPGVEVEETTAAGDTVIRYDTAANQFVYNWKTDAGWAGACRLLMLTLNDGTTHTALFRFR